MRILKQPLIPLLLAVCVCVLFAFYMSQRPVSPEGRYEYRPMVCINDQIYGEDGTSVKELPKGFAGIGQIKEKVSNVHPMIKRNYVSNNLKVGTRIFSNLDNPNEIYFKIDDSKYVKYLRIIEDDFD